MKKYFLLIFFSFYSLLCFSQYKSFSIESGLIFWKNIYENSEDLNELKTNPRIEFTSDSTGIIKKGNANPKFHQESSAEFKIEVKDERYRVSVFNIRFYNTTQISLYGVSTDITDYGIEEFLIDKKGAIKTRKNQVLTMDLLDAFFLDLFTIKTQGKKDDW